MDWDLWNVRPPSEFMNAPPEVVVGYLWKDDEANRQRSLSEFAAELSVVDSGLALLVEHIRGALGTEKQLEEDLQLRGVLTMFCYSLNILLAWRQLTVIGYVDETRVLKRCIHEAIIRAVAFAKDRELVSKFFRGEDVWPQQARDTAAEAIDEMLAGEKSELETSFKDIQTELRDYYRRLSLPTHPSLESVQLRTFGRSEVGYEELAANVPRGMMYGGIMSSGLGLNAIVGLALSLESVLGYLGLYVKDTTGTWKSDVLTWRAEVAAMRGRAEASHL